MRGVRKLAAASTGYCAAVFASHYLLPEGQLGSALILCLIVLLSAFLTHGNMRLRIVIFAVAAALGFSHYALNGSLTLERCEPFDGSKMQLSARVTDYPDERSGFTLLYVKITDESVPNVNAAMFCYSDELPSLRPGDEITFTAKLRSASERYGEETDTNISKGVYLYGSVEGLVEKTGRWGASFIYFPKYIGHALHTEIGEVFPDDASHFMKALLAGYKGDYYNDDRLYCAMNIAGLAHVAFLVGVLQSVMGKTRRSGIICILLVWIFVVMVGMPLSAVRAGVMMSMILLAPVLGRINDRPTTLSFALALILLTNPFAAGSVALQLSFGAVAGMFLFASPIYAAIDGKLNLPRSLAPIGNYISATLASSLSVTVFTVPLLAVHFGYVTLLAPIMNILCLWAISVLFTGGFIICALGLISAPAASFLANILSYLVRYIALVVESAVKLPYAAVYTENRYVPAWIAATYAAFALYAVIKCKKPKLTVLAPTAVCVILLIGVFSLTARDARNDDGTIGIMNVGNGQCIAVTQGGSAVVIDCGSHGIIGNAGNMLSSYLHSHGHDTVDCLVLTHLHKDHASGVVRLLNFMSVKTLVLPDNAQDTSSDCMLEGILAAAETNGTQIVYITQDTNITAGAISLAVYESSERGQRSESGIMLTASIGEYDMLVTGDVEKTVERELVRTHELEGTELLIVPHHGSKYSTSTALLSETQPETTVISTGYNTYGHPTVETLELLREYGAEILRTDELGRIVIHISAGG